MGEKPPPSTRSVSEIIASIQRSKTGIQDWSLSDLTIGLFLIYLRQASVNPFEDVNGVQISSNSMVMPIPNLFLIMIMFSYFTITLYKHIMLCVKF